MSEKKPKPLTPNELRFCAIYCSNGRNGTRAYMAIKPRARERSAGTKAALWLTKDRIREEIGRITTEAIKAEHMNADEVLREWARIAGSDLKDLVWKPGELTHDGLPTIVGARKPLHELPDRVSRALKTLKVKDGEVEVAMIDKNPALAQLGKFHGLTPDKANIDVRMKWEDLIGGIDDATE